MYVKADNSVPHKINSQSIFWSWFELDGNKPNKIQLQ